MKMVMIMVILILALMTVIGAFLISGVGNFYISEFYVQMERTFSPEFITQLQDLADGENGPTQMKELLMAQTGLGIDVNDRNVYILDIAMTSSLVVLAALLPIVTPTSLVWLMA